MTVDLRVSPLGQYPADIRNGAGIKIAKVGLRADISLDLSQTQKLDTVPVGGLVPVQDPATGLVQALDLSKLPTSNPPDGAVGNAKLAAAPALTVKGNATAASAQPQDISLSSLAEPGNPLGDAILSAVGTPRPLGLLSSARAPQSRTAYERDTDNAVSVLEYIDKAKHAQIRAGTWAGDLSDEINAALATGRNVLFPDPGVYPVAKKLVCTGTGQHLFSSGDRTTTVIRVLFSFDLPASSVLQLADHGAVSDIGFDFQQPTGDRAQPAGGLVIWDGTGTRPANGIVQYPWAIDVRTAQRARIRNVRIGKAWNGINAQADGAQGLCLDNIEDGCLNFGMVVGTPGGAGPADFSPIGVYHAWVFGSVGTGLQDWSEANPGSITINSVDGFHCALFTAYQRVLIVNAVPRAGISTPLTVSFGSIKLDSFSARMIAQAGKIVIGTLDVSNSGNVNVLDVTAAFVSVGAMRLQRSSSAPSPLVRLSGGGLNIGCGEIGNPGTTHDIEANAGVLQISNVRFTGDGTQAKPNGFIYENGARVFVSFCHFQDASGPGINNGFGVCLTTNGQHIVFGNFFGNRKIRQPASPVSNVLGPNNGVSAISTF